jgi:hypothetical protein
VEPACQRERRRCWQRVKRQNDPDYQDNQARAQRAWQKRNPDYWRDYRREHPQYRERNCSQQRERNARRRECLIAKMDASTPVFPVPSGIYRIGPLPATGIAKMGAWADKWAIHLRTTKVIWGQNSREWDLGSNQRCIRTPENPHPDL